MLLQSWTKAQELLFAVSQVPDINKTLVSNLGASGRYNSFACAIPPGADRVSLYTRSGTDHLHNGRIDRINYSPSANTYTSPATVLTPPAGKDFRCAVGGVVGGEKIILFLGQYDPAADVFDNISYVLSTDLQGNSFSTPTPLPLPSGATRGLVYGRMIASDVAGTYYQPAYAAITGSTGSVVWLYKFDYSAGAISNVSIIEIYRGTSLLTETTVERLGGGKFIALARVNGRNVLVQTTSTDGGATWSAPVDTNMGDGLTYAQNSASDIVPELRLINGTLVCLFINRVTGWMQTGKVAYSGTLPAATGWTVANYFQINIPGLGYATMCFLPGYIDRVFVSWAKENSATSTTVYARQEDFN